MQKIEKKLEEIKMSTKKGRKRNQGNKEKVFDKNEDKERWVFVRKS